MSNSTRRQWQDFQVVETLTPDPRSGWVPVGFPALTVGQEVWPILDVEGRAAYLTTTRPRTSPGGQAVDRGWLGDVKGYGLYAEGPARVVSASPVVSELVED